MSRSAAPNYLLMDGRTKSGGNVFSLVTTTALWLHLDTFICREDEYMVMFLYLRNYGKVFLKLALMVRNFDTLIDVMGKRTAVVGG